jgi:hypothetical protein
MPLDFVTFEFFDSSKYGIAYSTEEVASSKRVCRGNENSHI